MPRVQMSEYWSKSLDRCAVLLLCGRDARYRRDAKGNGRLGPLLPQCPAGCQEAPNARLKGVTESAFLLQNVLKMLIQTALGFSEI